MTRAASTCWATAALVIATAGCGGTGAEPSDPAPAATTQPAVGALAPGEPFPSGTYVNLNPDPGGTIALGADVGHRPAALYYWVPGNVRSEEVFRELEALVGEIGRDRIALYGVAVPRPNAPATAISARVRALGLRSPVIEDRDFQIGKRLEVAHVPHIALLDRDGRLQLSNGASLRQTVTAGVDLASTIRETAQTGTLATHGALGRYFPVTELEGSPCPDFRARLLADSVERSWSGLMDGQKLNVLIFWSVDCPHCRHAMPEINAWLRQNPDGLNVVSAARISNDATRIKTREFCDYNGFVFPTLIDDSDLTDLFRVTSTPTFVFIRPDGVIDSAVITSDASVTGTFERKKREILGS